MTAKPALLSLPPSAMQSLHSNLAAFQPQFLDVASGLQALSKELNRTCEKIATQVRAAQLRVLTPELQAALEEFARKERLGERMETAGWLPSRFAPFDLVQDNASASDRELGEVLDHYFRDRWNDIEAGFRKRLLGYDVDEEAKASFVEALEAHRHGLYRTVPRTLFPEIERVVRIEFHGGGLRRLTDQKFIRDGVLKLGPRDIEPSGVFGMRIVNKFLDDLYESIPTEERLRAVAVDPVPNRHAALHGLVVYRTAQTSLNSLIMAEFMLSVVSALKRGETGNALNGP